MNDKNLENSQGENQEKSFDAYQTKRISLRIIIHALYIEIFCKTSHNISNTLGMGIKKGLRRDPIFVNLKSNTMKNTLQR